MAKVDYVSGTGWKILQDESLMEYNPLAKTIIWTQLYWDKGRSQFKGTKSLDWSSHRSRLKGVF